MLDINKIYQGDCLELIKQIEDKSIDLILTDPPYNTGMKASTSKDWLSNFFNDDMSDKDYINLVSTSCKEFFRVLKNDRGGYIYINWKKMQLWIDKLKESGFEVKNVIVWDKVIHGLNYQNYAYTYEMIIYFKKGKPELNNKRLEDNKNQYYKDIWHIKRDIGNADNIEKHETVKQIKVIKLPILHSSKEGDVVLDCFMGSGTTAVACKQLGRNFIGIELSEEYCKIANERLSQQILNTKKELDQTEKKIMDIILEGAEKE